MKERKTERGMAIDRRDKERRKRREEKKRRRMERQKRGKETRKGETKILVVVS